jgi:hypothetical protein
MGSRVGVDACNYITNYTIVSKRQTLIHICEDSLDGDSLCFVLEHTFDNTNHDLVSMVAINDLVRGIISRNDLDVGWRAYGNSLESQ